MDRQHQLRPGAAPTQSLSQIAPRLNRDRVGKRKDCSPHITEGKPKASPKR